MARSSKQPAGGGPLASNRKAFHNYTVLERFEAGMALRGTEVKSARAGRISIEESYAQVEDGQVTVYELTIMPYEFGTAHNHNPKRPRRLLLHKAEIKRLHAQTVIKGLALIPLKMYLKHGHIKMELGLCKGKQLHDKRDTLRERTAKLEAARAMAARRHR